MSDLSVTPEAPRDAEVDRKTLEAELATLAVNAANVYAGWTLFAVIILAIAIGSLAGHLASDDAAPVSFCVGAVLGFIVLLPVFLRARMQVYDLRRRQIYMDRR